MVYQIAPDFCSYSRRGNRRIVDYVTVAATQKTDEKTSRMVFHLTEIALETEDHIGFFHEFGNAGGIHHLDDVLDLFLGLPILPGDPH